MLRVAGWPQLRTLPPPPAGGGALCTLAACARPAEAALGRASAACGGRGALLAVLPSALGGAERMGRVGAALYFALLLSRARAASSVLYGCSQTKVCFDLIIRVPTDPSFPFPPYSVSESEESA